MVAPLVALINS